MKFRKATYPKRSKILFSPKTVGLTVEYTHREAEPKLTSKLMALFVFIVIDWPEFAEVTVSPRDDVWHKLAVPTLIY